MKFNFFRKYNSKKGYSVSEYMLVILLVMAGVLIMTRYVFRSWHANVKGWEDAVQDSYNDPLIEGQNVTIPGCNCSTPWTTTCGVATGTDGHPNPAVQVTCPLYYVLETRSCTNHCATEAQCSPSPDPACCNAWTFQACSTDCGPYPTGACPQGFACAWRFCGGNISIPSDQQWACLDMNGSPPLQIGSNMGQIDHTQGCVFSCAAPYGDGSTPSCPGDDQNLTANSNTHYINWNGVANGECSASLIDPPFCEMECAQGSFPVPNPPPAEGHTSCFSCSAIPASVPEGVDPGTGLGCNYINWGWDPAHAAPPAPGLPPQYWGPWGCEVCNDPLSGHAGDTGWCQDD